MAKFQSRDGFTRNSSIRILSIIEHLGLGIRHSSNFPTTTSPLSFYIRVPSIPIGRFTSFKKISTNGFPVILS